jgi:hypothetical protein
MRNLLLVLVAACGLSAVSAFADKPGWAGEGGKPSAHEIERHKDEMRHKNSDKKYKKGKDGSYQDRDWDEGDADKAKKKYREREWEEDKGKGKHQDKDDWEKDRKKLEDNVRANNRGMIGAKPLN